MEIIEGFKKFDNVKNMHFDSLADFNANRGKFVNETKYEIGGFNTEDSMVEDGVYIYAHPTNERKALRVYKDIVDYKHTYHTDENVVSELQKRQPNVKLSEFPEAVITIEDKVVGQLIPYYPNTKTLHEAFKTGDFQGKCPTQYLVDMLRIQRELIVNGIISSDCHPKNFIIENGVLRPIDFEEQYVYFDGNKYRYGIMMDTLIHGINVLTEEANIPFREDMNIRNIDNIDNLNDEVNELDYKVRTLKK